MSEIFEFLNEKNKQQTDIDRITAATKEEFKIGLAALYHQIEGWLGKAKEAGLVSLTLSQEKDFPTLTIKTKPGSSILLDPDERLIVNAKGVVRIKGKKSYKLSFTQAGWELTRTGSYALLGRGSLLKKDWNEQVFTDMCKELL